MDIDHYSSHALQAGMLKTEAQGIHLTIVGLCSHHNTSQPPDGDEDRVLESNTVDR